MTTKLRVTLHKADSLPKKVETLDFPLLETSDKFIVHGFAYGNYLEDLEDASTIFAEGASIDLAMADCFVKSIRSEGPMVMYAGFTPAFIKLAPYSIISLTLADKLTKAVTGRDAL